VCGVCLLSDCYNATKEDVVAFDEVNCDAFYCLPIKDIRLESGPFPLELNVKGFNGTVSSKIQIDDVTYVK